MANYWHYMLSMGSYMPGFRKRFKYDEPWEVIKAVCPLKQSMEEDYNGIKARGQETVLLARHQRMGKTIW